MALPTDTLYGLAVDPRDARAVRALFAAKRRAADVAVPLIAADVHQVERDLGTLTGAARELARRFWPGPLALVLDAPSSIASPVCGAGRTVAVRVPAHAVARALARAAGHPLTATSANRSGEAAASDANEVLRTLGESVEVILDGGPAPGGAPSTIVDARGERPKLVRPGAVAWNRVLAALGQL